MSANERSSVGRSSIDDISSSPKPEAAAVEFAHLVGRLKTTPRTGWVRRGVPRYESVADHSWRVAVLSLLLAGDDDGIDVSKCIKLGLLHDIAECVVGDITPQDNVSKEEKARLEQQAMDEITGLLERAMITKESAGVENSPDVGGEQSISSASMLRDLTHEYEARQSQEAQAVKDLDLLDMILQADEYEERFEMDLSEFFEGTPPSRFRTPVLQRIAKEVHAQRDARREKPAEDSRSSLLSKKDAAFVEEYCMASGLSRGDIEKTVLALRNWEECIE